MNEWIHWDGMKDQIIRFLINVNQFHKSMTHNELGLPIMCHPIISDFIYKIFLHFLNSKHLICKVILNSFAILKLFASVLSIIIGNMLSWSFIRVIYVVEILPFCYYMWFYKFIFYNIFCYLNIVLLRLNAINDYNFFKWNN